MRFNALFCLLLLSCLCFALAQVSFDDCCLKYMGGLRKRAQKHAVNYKDQLADGGCNINAVILFMRRGFEFCVDPKEPWVQILKKKLDGRKGKSTKPGRKHHPRRSN